jgi:Asp-tRNA(Asn)/Glu-tRNA(Gln) amidotransferase B subunit
VAESNLTPVLFVELVLKDVIAKSAIANNPKIVADVESGNKKAMNSLMAQANPGMVMKMLNQKLS